MDVLTSHTETIAMIAGALVLVLAVAWALRAPHPPGRRVIPEGRPEALIFAVLVLDGCALVALGAFGALSGDDDAGAGTRQDARVTVTAPPAAPAATTSGDGTPAAPPATAPAPADAAPPATTTQEDSPTPDRPRRSGAFLVARLSGDGASPGRGDANGRGGVWLDVRPGRRHLCFDMAVDSRITGSITQANVYREAAGEGALPHLTLVVPDGKDARRRRGCAYRPPTSALRAVVDAPGDFHVTIFNEAHPTGAVRGTLRTCPRPCRTRGPDLLG